jgi:hypothetical protein
MEWDEPSWSGPAPLRGWTSRPVDRLMQRRPYDVLLNTHVHRCPWKQDRRDVSRESPMDTASPSIPQRGSLLAMGTASSRSDLCKRLFAVDGCIGYARVRSALHQMVLLNTHVHRCPWKQDRRDVSRESPMDTASLP